MDVASVTFEEVLKAAQIRVASLVPETSGYLALAIADASARLPFFIEDDMVLLSTEGTVRVMRGTEVVSGEESARRLREMLAMLLARSVGGMHGLTQASRERDDSGDSVATVIADLEAALVPVNRSAARRALARLARETARARDQGKLKRVRRDAQTKRPKSRPQPQEQPRQAAPPQAPDRSRASSPGRDDHRFALPRERTPEEERVEARVERPRAERYDVSMESIDVVFTDAPSPVEPVVEPALPTPEPTPTVIATTLGEIEGLLLRPDRHDEARPRHAPRAAPKKRGVEDLLASFSVSSFDSERTMRDTQASLLDTLNLTPPPPTTKLRSTKAPVKLERVAGRFR